MDLIETQMKEPIKHWYYAHKYNSIRELILSDLVKANVLIDVGAGSALFSHEILKFAHQLECFAIDTGYEVPVSVDSINRITYLQEANHIGADIYLLTDVLEHVPNDVELLSSYVDSAPVGALFVITVPAFMSLWSGHDVYLKHFTRYRKKTLSACAIEAGLIIESVKYLYVPLFPIAWFLRKLNSSKKEQSQMRDHGRFANEVASFVLKFDSILARFFPFGISIIMSARKVN
jgi:hypothetical protein